MAFLSAYGSISIFQILNSNGLALLVIILLSDAEFGLGYGILFKGFLYATLLSTYAIAVILSQCGSLLGAIEQLWAAPGGSIALLL